MSFRAIESDIKSGSADKAAPLLLYGEERFLTGHYEKQLIAMFMGGAETVGNPDIVVFYGSESSDDDIMSALDTVPMISPVRIVAVRGHKGLSGGPASAPGESGPKAKSGLKDYISHIPDTSRLIFSAGSVNKGRELYKAIAKTGAVYEFARLDGSDLANFVRKRFKAMNADIPPDVLDSFVFSTGYLESDSDRDLFTVESDAYKVASFALSEGRDAISHFDIEECMPGILRADVFAMLDAISSGRKAEAVRLFENSLTNGESTFRLLSLFTTQFEIMLGCRELSAAGHSLANTAQILGERREWLVKKLGGLAQRFDIESLRTILSRLYEIERDIKSGDIPDRLALTVLLSGI